MGDSTKKRLANKVKGIADKFRLQRPRTVPAPDGSRRPKGDMMRPAKDVETQVILDSLSVQHQQTLDELAILRKTRGQRDVGALKVPAHLREALPIRPGPAGHVHADPREQARCPLCADRNSDAGVETRSMRAGGDD